jgi:hypothetical protein
MRQKYLRIRAIMVMECDGVLSGPDIQHQEKFVIMHESRVTGRRNWTLPEVQSFHT